MAKEYCSSTGNVAEMTLQKIADAMTGGSSPGGGGGGYDDTEMRGELATKLSRADLVIKGASKDNVSVAAGKRVNSEIVVVGADEEYTIVGFKRVFIENATEDGANRDNIALQSMSTGSNGTRANIAVRNCGTANATIKISVECLCIQKSCLL